MEANINKGWFFFFPKVISISFISDTEPFDSHAIKAMLQRREKRTAPHLHISVLYLPRQKADVLK